MSAPESIWRSLMANACDREQVALDPAQRERCIGLAISRRIAPTLPNAIGLLAGVAR